MSGSICIAGRQIAGILAFGLSLIPVDMALAAVPQTPAQVAIDHGPQDLDADTKCLALAVYWEGRDESRRGQLAIAHTVLNRVADAAFPDSICAVVAQGNGRKGSCQFSWWCDGKSDKPQNIAAWEIAVATAREVLRGGSADPTRGALFFHHVRVKTNWGGSRERLMQIGDHVFYR